MRTQARKSSKPKTKSRATKRSKAEKVFDPAKVETWGISTDHLVEPDVDLNKGFRFALPKDVSPGKMLYYKFLGKGRPVPVMIIGANTGRGPLSLEFVRLDAARTTARRGLAAYLHSHIENYDELFMVRIKTRKPRRQK